MGGITMRADRVVVGRYTRPYAIVGVVALVRAAYARRFPSADALDRPGVRIAVNAGGHLERVARQRFPRATIDAVPDNRAVPQRVLNGKADAALTDTAEARDWLRPGLHAVGPFRFDHKAYLLPAADDALAARVDEWLAAREADGWMAGARARWLGTPATANPADATREAVAAFIGLRLRLMPAVAGAKRAAALPIEDPEQEGRVLERVRAAASRPAYVVAVYRQLITLGKAVQRDAPAADVAVSLDALRAALARIDPPLVRELDRASGSLAAWRVALSRTVTGPGIDETDVHQLADVLATPPQRADVSVEGSERWGGSRQSISPRRHGESLQEMNACGWFGDSFLVGLRGKRSRPAWLDLSVPPWGSLFSSQPCCQMRLKSPRWPNLATRSSAATSSGARRQPRAPQFCSACAAFLAPGIGTAPLQINQFSATCAGVLWPCTAPSRRSSAMTGSISPIG
jgi:cyclohexadienyl dehydratase